MPSCKCLVVNFNHKITNIRIYAALFLKHAAICTLEVAHEQTSMVLVRLQMHAVRTCDIPMKSIN